MGPDAAAINSSSSGLVSQVASAVGQEEDDSDEENEDVAASRVLQHFLEEAKLDEKAKNDGVEVKARNIQSKGKKKNLDAHSGDDPMSAKLKVFCFFNLFFLIKMG